MNEVKNIERHARILQYFIIAKRGNQVSVILRLLALLGVIWTGKQVVTQVSSIFHPQQHVDEEKVDGEIRDEMVKDPVCQTFIPKSIAIKKTFHDKAVFFCSEECATKFSEQEVTESQ